MLQERIQGRLEPRLGVDEEGTLALHRSHPGLLNVPRHNPRKGPAQIGGQSVRLGVVRKPELGHGLVGGAKGLLERRRNVEGPVEVESIAAS